MFLWFSKTCFLIWIVCIHKDGKLGTKTVFPRSSKQDLDFCNYETACKHIDLSPTISLLQKTHWARVNKVFLHSCLYNDLSHHSKSVTYRTFYQLCLKWCFCKFEYYATQTPKTIKELPESLTKPKFANFPLQKVYTSL